MNLHLLIDRLTVSIFSYANKEIKIVNNINPFLQAEAREEILNNLLSNLLGQATFHAKSKHIRISSRAFHNVILMNIKYKDPRPVYDLEKDLSEVKNQAEMLGGCLYFAKNKINGTNISLTFINHQISASVPNWNAKLN